MLAGAAITAARPPINSAVMKGRTLVLRLSYGGSKAWRVGYYIDGRPKARTIGHYPELKVARGGAAGNFREVAETWLRHYVEAATTSCARR
jgi:hypothetical protein